MAINLPNVSTPGQSFQQGFKSVNDLFDKIRQHQLERQKLQEAVKQHADLIKFKMLAENRANQEAARNQEIHGERLKKLKHENADDEYFDNAIGGGNESSMPNEGMRHEGATSQTEGINNPNTGILNGQHDVDMNGNPVGGGEPQQSAENVQGAQSESPVMKMIQDRARKYPKFRALYIKKYKVDPLASLPQTPEEKQQMALETNKLKLDQKAEADKNKSTNAVKTQNQNIVNIVPRANRMIDKLIEAPSPTEFPLYRKGARAAHHALVKEAAENYAKAKGWPNTGESIKTASEILGRGQLETDSDYRKRLNDLKDELNLTMKEAQETLIPGKSPTKNENIVIQYARDSSGRIVPKK